MPPLLPSNPLDPRQLRLMLPSACAPLKHIATASKHRVLSSGFATVRNLRHAKPEPEEPDPGKNDFILSILRAKPSLRDSKVYLDAFGPPIRRPERAPSSQSSLTLPNPPFSTTVARNEAKAIQETPTPTPLVASILNPVLRRTALVKMQGPFTDRQLESIARGMVYLEKLGLVSVIVVELDDWVRGEAGEKTAVVDETMRIVSALERQGARARPVLQSVVRLGPSPGDAEVSGDGTAQKDPSEPTPPEAHTTPHDLVSIRSALRAGEIPVLPPLALDSFLRSVRIHSNDVIGALARGMVEAGSNSSSARQSTADEEDASAAAAPAETDGVDLTPLRLMIINREGGVPSYARSGLPHLLVNLTAEYSYIHDTFHESWLSTNPTALENLALARTCLSYMPPSSSAIMVSHRSPSSLIANLITNRPEVSSSLPHALLQGQGRSGTRRLTQHTPTFLRRGAPVRVVSRLEDLDRAKLTTLLEQSFRKTLSADAYYTRLADHFDYAIVAGDYAGAAIVTREVAPDAPPGAEPVAYLDKFAVLPSHQGDGTVDFLWVALHDESYGLGLSFSVNPNGGKEGCGEGRELVWRSRADNPVNKWYFDRSTGHVRMGKWVMFWCDAEKRLKIEEGRRGSAGLSYCEEWERGRLSYWTRTIDSIPSCWT